GSAVRDRPPVRIDADRGDVGDRGPLVQRLVEVVLPADQQAVGIDPIHGDRANDRGVAYQDVGGVVDLAPEAAQALTGAVANGLTAADVGHGHVAAVTRL